MKKFKGYIHTEEGSYGYFRTKLKKYGATQVKGKEPEGECEYFYVFLTFKASYRVVRRLLLDNELINKVFFKDFPISQLVKRSHFCNMKIIQDSEFNPMLYHTESRIGWHVDLETSIYLAIYSQNKNKWDKDLKGLGFANAEYACIDNFKIRLYGYNTIQELYPYINKRREIDFRPTYYLEQTNILHTLPPQFLTDYLNTHPKIYFNISERNLFTQLLDEQIKANKSDIPKLMKDFIQSKSYNPQKCELSITLSNHNRLANIFFPKNISNLLITTEFVELTYEDNKTQRYYFSSKRLHINLAKELGKPLILIEHFIAMDILHSINMYFVLPF